MGEFRWSPEEGIDVSSKGKYPYKLFSPFAYDKTYRIPVPGFEDMRADSVEGIWQGLKIINGKTKAELFTGKPRKREGRVEGHAYGNEVLNYLQARKLIYVPAYIYHAVNNALPRAWQCLEQKIADSDIFLHDVEKNGSINDTSSPFAHSVILAELLNVIKDSPLPKSEHSMPNPYESRFTYLHEQVNALCEYRIKLPEERKKLLDEVITFAYLFNPDVKKQDFALNVIKEAEIETDRLKKYTPVAQTQKIYNALRR
ncbi:MAG: hypothetical protein QW165_03435 [Candidatus Woesearchaeota archaeon]